MSKHRPPGKAKGQRSVKGQLADARGDERGPQPLTAPGVLPQEYVPPRVLGAQQEYVPPREPQIPAGFRRGAPAGRVHAYRTRVPADGMWPTGRLSLAELRSLAPSLAGLQSDDELSVYFVTGDAAPPAGAGPLLGRTGEDKVLEDGTAIPAGTRMYLSPREEPAQRPIPAEAEGAIIRLRPAEVLQLHERLARRMAARDPAWVRFFDGFIRETAERAAAGGGPAGRKFWDSMFTPARSGSEYAGIQARHLARARTYQVDAAMTYVVTAAYERNAGQGTYTLDQAELPWPAGFVWLDKPIRVITRAGGHGFNRALSWGTEYQDGPAGRRPAVRITSWSWKDDRDSYWTEDVYARMAAFGGLVLAFSRLVPLDEPVITTHGVNGTTGESDTIDWTRLLWHTLSSQIAAAPRAHVDTRTTRQARRTLRHGEVHVITLRRPASEHSEEHGHREASWTCRWPVQEFWRHVRLIPGQPAHHAVPDSDRTHCITCGARVSRVAPHIKGPAGLPLKQDRQLYRLSR